MSIFERGHLSLQAVPQSRPIDVDVHVSRCRYWCRPKCRWWCWCWFWCIWACLRQSSYLSRISRFISVEKKLSCGEISAFYTEFEQFMEFYRSLCCFLLQIYVGKICAEKISVEKKWQIWGLQGWRASEQSSGVMLRAFGRPTKIIWKSESFQLCRLIKNLDFAAKNPATRLFVWFVTNQKDALRILGFAKVM